MSAGKGGVTGGDEGAGQGDKEDILANFVLDESFIKAATVKEESARTRELRSQWKKEPPKSEPWRSWQGGPGDQGSGSGSGKQTAHPAAVAYAKRQRRNRLASLRKSIAPLLVFALIIGGYVFYHTRHIVTASSPPAINPNLTAMPTGTNARASVAPNATCFAGTAGCGSMTQPYADSPAAAWADGADGIVLPAATATGDFSSSQVSQSLSLSKQFVVDQTLVPDVLVNGATPTALLALFSPASHFSTEVAGMITNPTVGGDPSGTFVRFDPKTSALIATPKVSGTVTYAQSQAGSLQVLVSLKIVYALKKPDGSAWTRVIADVEDNLRFYNGDGNYADTMGTVWPYDAGIDNYAGAACGFNGGLVEPWYQVDHESGPLPTGTPEDPYATAPPPPAPTATATGDSCSTTSRT